MQGQQKTQIKIIEYRNGIYQGQVKGNKRHGQGILITDQNTIIVSDWKNDLMSGKGLVIFNPDHYGFGEFNRGEIQGGFLFRNKNKTLFSQFNLSRPINKMVLIDYETEILQIVAHKAPIYQVLGEKKLQYDNESEEIFESINMKFPAFSLLDFIQQELCKINTRKKQNNVLQKQTSTTFLDELGQQRHNFKEKILNNSNYLFYYDDPSNPTSLGFCLNKNQQLVSWGMYVNDKLSGLGCKYENTVRYQGMFQGGFVNGIGLKLSQGKFSFGQFQNGNLVEALYIQDRSNVSEQKLQQFKKLQHIRSMWHENAYIRRNLIKFKGVNELVFQINSQQQYMYPQLITSLVNVPKKQGPISGNHNSQSPQYIQVNRSTSRNQDNYNSNISNTNNSHNLALNMLLKRQGDKLETKSSKQFFVRPNTLNSKNETSSHVNTISNPMNAHQSPNVNMNKNKNILIGNTANGRMNSVDYADVEDQDEDDVLSQAQRSTSGLRNLRKYKY